MSGMTVAAFEDFVASAGPDPHAWPATVEAAAAEALLARSSEAQGILAAHADLALALAPLSDATCMPSAALTERILGDAAALAAERTAPPSMPATPKPQPRIGWMIALWHRRTVLGPAAACAASAAFGLWMGLSAPAEMTDMAGGTLTLDLVEPQEVAALFPWDLQQ